ncbi:MAG: GTP cyclohydrolase I FolE [Acidobacteria bacterium]|nr:MAG: GTP cyclohydrolase I FolE [Acidobacteriota bacterium]
MTKQELRPQALEAVDTLLQYIGENPEREGLIETPERVIKSYDEIFGGYKMEPSRILKTFRDGSESVDEMVIQRNIHFFSMCEHHMIPFFGVAHVAYVPEKEIVGLSKLARLVEVYARRLQVQERMTTQITQALMTHLKPKGAACVIQATHLCMVQRGIKKHQSDTITSSLEGVFRSGKTRAEYLNLIGLNFVNPIS